MSDAGEVTTKVDIEYLWTKHRESLLKENLDLVDEFDHLEASDRQSWFTSRCVPSEWDTVYPIQESPANIPVTQPNAIILPPEIPENQPNIIILHPEILENQPIISLRPQYKRQG